MLQSSTVKRIRQTCDRFATMQRCLYCTAANIL